MLCKFKNILGKPKTGLHRFRIFNIAIIDVLLTILGAYIISRAVPKWDFYIILAGLFILGIILHRVFCVRTTIDKLVFN